MTQLPSQAPVVEVKPQPNIYTLLLIVAIIALGTTVGIVMHNLMSPVVRSDGGAGGYGMSFGDLFETLENLIPRK